MKVKEIKPDNRRFQIELDSFEAGVLYKIIGNISGDSGLKVKSVADELYDKLKEMSIVRRGKVKRTMFIIDD